MLPHHTRNEIVSQTLLKGLPRQPSFSSEEAGILPHPSLIESGIDDTLKKIAALAGERRSAVERSRDRILVRNASIDEGVCSKRIVGVDAGRNGHNLQLAFIPLYGAIAVLAENWNVVDSLSCAGASDIWTVERDPDKRENLLHMALEYHAAKKSLEAWHPDYLLFDGALVLNPRLRSYPSDSVGYREDFRFTAITALDLLHTCQEKGIPVMGFVKRTKMNRLHGLLGLPPMRDLALLNVLLGSREYVDPFLVDNPMALALYRMAEEMEVCGERLRIYTTYIRTSPKSVYRVEIPEFCLDRIEELLSIAFLMADPDGIPYPIHEADRLSKMTGAASNIHLLALFEKTMDLIKAGSLSPEDLDLFTPQYGDYWSLEG